MISNKIAMAAIMASLTVTPINQASADGGDIAGGIIGGIIGGVIVNEATRNRNQTRTRTRTVTQRTTPRVSSAQRQHNREIQTSLNYFGFPAGAPDGVMGRRTQAATANYQAFMGYSPSGYLNDYERQFLIGSYHRAISGGVTTSQLIAQSTTGTRGLLHMYRDEAAGISVAASPAPAIKVLPGYDPEGSENPEMAVKADPGGAGDTGATSEEQPETTLTALPNFLAGGDAQPSLASHCNQISLLTNSNGGFVTEASMSDPNFALNEQFCIARTYAIAQGEQLAANVTGVSAAQIEQQCESFGPAMREHVAALSLKPHEQVMQDVSGFILSTGMSPAQLSGTAKICLSVGYRTDSMDVALGSALLLTVLGERVYGELMGHHLAQGFGTSTRPDLALAWYQVSLDALEAGAESAFAPGNTDRPMLIRKAAYQINGRSDGAAIPTAESVQPAATLPTFSVNQ